MAIPLHSHVDRDEGAFLANFVETHSDIIRTLEVGCAYGLSSLHICGGLRHRDGAHHIIVDPFQNVQWQGIGVANLRRAGITFLELVESRSEFALPRLAETQPESLDMVFIDGWHTFDHTLVDLFYANRLIRTGGYIIVDDCGWRGVAKAVSCPSSEHLAQLAA